MRSTYRCKYDILPLDANGFALGGRSGCGARLPRTQPPLLWRSRLCRLWPDWTVCATIVCSDSKPEGNHLRDPPRSLGNGRHRGLAENRGEYGSGPPGSGRFLEAERLDAE